MYTNEYVHVTEHWHIKVTQVLLYTCTFNKHFILLLYYTLLVSSIICTVCVRASFLTCRHYGCSAHVSFLLAYQYVRFWWIVAYKNGTKPKKWLCFTSSVPLVLVSDVETFWIQCLSDVHISIINDRHSCNSTLMGSQQYTVQLTVILHNFRSDVASITSILRKCLVVSGAVIKSRIYSRYKRS